METHPKQRLFMTFKKGFTLPEVLVTVAIVGTVAAVAVPQYLRYRTDANMEMVRQHMRLIGEKMIEILGREGKFPSPEDWRNWDNGGLTNSPEEMDLTANLSAIDNYCYTTNDYATDAAGSSYRFCSRPKMDACRRMAGSKQFCVHFSSEMSSLFAPGEVGALELSDAPFTEMIPSWYYNDLFNFSAWANDAGFDTAIQMIIDDARRLELLAVESLLYSEDYHPPSYTLPDDLFNSPLGILSYSHYIHFSEQDAGRMNEIYNALLNQGIAMHNKEISIDTANQAFQTTNKYIYGILLGDPDWIESALRDIAPSDHKAYEISFEFERPDITPGDFQGYVTQNEWLPDYCTRRPGDSFCADYWNDSPWNPANQ